MSSSSPSISSHVASTLLAARFRRVLERSLPRFRTCFGFVSIALWLLAGWINPALAQAPAIQQALPAVSTTQGGTTVTIIGDNFVPGATTITIGETVIPADQVNVYSYAGLNFTAPEHVAGNFDLTITTADGEARLAGGFTYLDAEGPVVTGLDPAAGPPDEWQPVNVFGVNFTGATDVLFGGRSAENGFDIYSDGWIRLLAPPGTGTVDVQVVTPSGTSEPDANARYTYNAAPVITSIEIVDLDRREIIVHGHDLLGVSTGDFFFRDYVAHYANSNAEGTEITANPYYLNRPPLGESEIWFYADGGLASATVCFCGAPSIKSVSPASGSPSGGTTMTLTGVAFKAGGTSVTIGGVVVPAQAVTVVDEETLTFKAPPHAAGAVEITATTEYGTSAPKTGGFTYIAVTPTANPVSATVEAGSENNVISLDITGVAADNVEVVSQAAHGVAVAEGTVMTYTPNAGYTGPDSFTYRAINGDGPSSPATVSINVTPQFPVAGNASVAVLRDSGASILAPLLSGGQTDSIAVVTPPQHGTLLVSGLNFLYTPDAGYFGPDSFTYTATNDGGTSAEAAFTIAVSSNEPVAGAVSITVDRNSNSNPVALNLSGGAATSVAIASPPAHGMATVAGTSITYTPETDFIGKDTFTYTATNAGGTSAPASVTVTVAPPPPPLASARSEAVPYETAVTIDLGSAILGSFDQIAVTVLPAHGAVEISGAAVTYTPDPGYYGADEFDYQAIGPGGASAAATVLLTVGAPPAPTMEEPDGSVIVPPASGEGSATVTIDLGARTQGVVNGFRITANARYGDALIDSSSSAATSRQTISTRSASSETFILAYTPRSDFMGTDTVTVVAYGPGGDSAPVTFNFQVAGKAPDITGRIVSQNEVTFTPTALITGGPFTALRITRAPDSGTASVRNLSIDYTPEPAGANATSFEYVIDLPFGSSASGRIAIVVEPGQGDYALTAETLQDRPVTVRISNVAGGPFTGAAITSISPADGGMATISGSNGTYDLTFTPQEIFQGAARVGFALTGPAGLKAGTLTVNVVTYLDPTGDEQLIGLLDEQADTVRRFARTQITNFHRRLEQLHTESGRHAGSVNVRMALMPNSASTGSAGGIESDVAETSRTAGYAQPYAVGKGAPGSEDLKRSSANDALKSPGSAPEYGAFAFWASGFVNFGESDSGGLDLDHTLVGMSSGLDYRFNDTFVGGLGVGFGRDRAEIGTEGTESRALAISAAAYGSYNPAPSLFLDGLIGGSWMDLDSRRFVAANDTYALGSRGGSQLFASLKATYEFRTDTWLIAPYGEIAVSRSWLDGFSEQGSGAYALTYDDQLVDTMSGIVGLRASRSFETAWGVISPGVRAEYEHDFAGGSSAVVTYSAGGSLPYEIDLDTEKSDRLVVGLSLDWQISPDFNINFDYRGGFDDERQTDHTLGARLNIRY